MIINPGAGSGGAKIVTGEIASGTVTFQRAAKAVIIDYKVLNQNAMRGAFLLLAGRAVSDSYFGSASLSSDGMSFTCAAERNYSFCYLALME